MEARIALFGCVVLGSTLCGHRIAGLSRRRERLLTDVLAAARRLKASMLGMLEPVPDALSHSGNAVFEEIGRRMADGASAREAWKQVLNAGSAHHLGLFALDAQDRQVLERLFERLGESGREAQEIHLSAAVEALESRTQDAESQRKQSTALSTRLGFLVGLMLGLIFL